MILTGCCRCYYCCSCWTNIVLVTTVIHFICSSVETVISSILALCFQKSLHPCRSGGTHRLLNVCDKLLLHARNNLDIFKCFSHLWQIYTHTSMYRVYRLHWKFNWLCIVWACIEFKTWVNRMNCSLRWKVHFDPRAYCVVEMTARSAKHIQGSAWLIANNYYL